jgi:hypothetical protein
MLNLLIVPVRPGELPTIPPDLEAVSPEPPAETEAEFRARLDRIVAAAAATRPAAEPSPSPSPPRQPTLEREPNPDKPDLSKPGALTESLRAMGLI